MATDRLTDLTHTHNWIEKWGGGEVNEASISECSFERQEPKPRTPQLVSYPQASRQSVRAALPLIHISTLSHLFHGLITFYGCRVSHGHLITFGLIVRMKGRASEMAKAFKNETEMATYEREGGRDGRRNIESHFDSFFRVFTCLVACVCGPRVCLGTETRLTAPQYPETAWN